MAEGVDLYGGFVGKAPGGYETRRSHRNWVAHVTVIDGSLALLGYPAYHVVLGADNASLDGFTITGGEADGPADEPTGRGGGMYNYYASPTVSHCVFTDNYAVHGGGMCIEAASPVVTACQFLSNSAMVGGAIEARVGGTPEVTNCVLAGNSAVSYAGAFEVSYLASPNLMNCTIADNSCNVIGGIRVLEAALTMTNCILWDNTDKQLNVYHTSTADVNYCDIQGGYSGTGLGNLNVDPLFANLPAWDFRLGAGSQCIDNGTATNAPDTDLLGLARPQGAGVDMGAYERLGEGLCFLRDTFMTQGNQLLTLINTEEYGLPDSWVQFDLENGDEWLPWYEAWVEFNSGTGPDPGPEPPLGDGIPDAWEMALLAEVMCAAWNPVIGGWPPYAEAVTITYQNNLAMWYSHISDALEGETDPEIIELLEELNDLAELMAGLIGLNQEAQDGYYYLLQRFLETVSIPNDFAVFTDGSKAAGEPFHGDGDCDNDGKTNLEEYQYVVTYGGDIDAFILEALYDDHFWPGNPALPAAGILGLGLLACAFALAGAAVLRRRRSARLPGRRSPSSDQEDEDQDDKA